MGASGPDRLVLEWVNGSDSACLDVALMEMRAAITTGGASTGNERVDVWNATMETA
jgi:hypothetical protein